MINKNESGRVYVCDDCKTAIKTFVSMKTARLEGWAVSRDYKRCYCPDCAPRHRHTGKYGAKIIRQEG